MTFPDFLILMSQRKEDTNSGLHPVRDLFKVSIILVQSFYLLRLLLF